MISSALLQLLCTSTRETFQMVGISLALAELLGLPLGVALVVTQRGHIWQNVALSRALGSGVNIVRSVPFIIALVAIIPLTRAIVGTSIGTAAAAVPLTVCAIPFVARLVESSLNEVDSGVTRQPKRWAPPGRRSWPRCCYLRPCRPWSAAPPSQP